MLSGPMPLSHVRILFAFQDATQNFLFLEALLTLAGDRTIGLQSLHSHRPRFVPLLSRLHSNLTYIALRGALLTQNYDLLKMKKNPWMQ